MNVKTMAISITTVMMVLAIFGVAGAMAAGQDDYGTKVAMCDVDDTYRLNPLPAAQQIMYVDNGPVGYGQEDDVYLDVDGVAVGGVFYVSPLDIRLTPVTRGTTTYPAGSQVQAGELDVNDVLIAPPSGRGGVLDVGYWDMPRSSPGGGMPFLNGLYDLSEPVYIDMDGGAAISINDVRLTGYSGCQPGAKVLGSDVDVTIPATALAPMPNYLCSFYDTDGNGNYNAGDHVIFDARITILAPPPFGLGSVNDIRLTPLVGCGVTYPYGTKITESRIDSVHVLGTPNQDAPFQLGFWDVTANGYTSDDPVYIDVLPPSGIGAGITSPGDVRLTPYGSNGAGSQMILTTDPDMGKPLITTWPIDISFIEFLDMTGDGYTPDDPVYIDLGNDCIVSVNDVILSEGTPSSGAGTPGSKVTSSSPYLNRQLTDFVTTIPGGININYFDANGDGWYQNILAGPIPLALGIGDYVFLDIGRQGYSSANDVRLTEPTFTYPFGSKVGPTEDCCVDGLVPLPTPFGPVNTRLMSWDITGGGFSDDDPVYLDTSNTFTGIWRVEAHDVRLTPLDHGGTHYDAGTVVKSGELDEFHGTNFIPWNRIRYYDINLDGYTPDDPVIIDQDDNYMISPLDVRLTPYSGFAAGSKVKVSDNDPYWHQPLIILTAVQAGWFDVDDRAYDGKDYVYLDIFNDNFVTVNDIRLTGLEGPGAQICTGDLNNDGVRNFGDVLVLIPKWGQACPGCPEDLNNDGIVNFGDVLVLIPVWGQACP